MKKFVRSKLRELRKINNYTQEQLAERLDISRSKVSSIENGKREMSINDAIKLAQLYKISLDNLLEIKDISEIEYIEIFNSFIQNKSIDLDTRLTILENAIHTLKEENLELFYENYKMTQNATK